MNKLIAILLLVVLYNPLISQNSSLPGTTGYSLTTSAPGKNQTQNNTNNGNGVIATSYTQTACGLNFVYASNPLYKRGFSFQVGLTQPAAFNISGLPVCHVIEKAFLYFGASGNGIATTATITNPNAVSGSFPMTIIGQHTDKCWGYPGSYAYRADVTSIIAGNGNYMISGLPTNPPVTLNDVDGAILFIIYTDPTQIYTGSIVMADGCQTQPTGPVSSTITGFNVCGTPLNTTNFLAVSDFQKIQNQNIALNSTATNYFLPTSAQQVWNFIVDPGAPAVNNQNSAIYSVPGVGDCYSMVLAGMYYQTNCLTCSPSSATNCLISPPNTNTTICFGSTAYVSINNPNNLSNPSYSIQPNGQTQSTPVFSVAPGVSTSYTLYVTGTNSASAVITQSSVATVSVLPAPVISPTIIQATCFTATNSANLNLTFNPSSSPNYTVNWTPVPSTITTVNSSTAAGLVPGVNNVTVTSQNGCKATASFVVLPTPQQASFVIINPSNDYTLTCNNPNIVLTTSVTNGVPLTYTWFPSCTSTVVGASMNFSQPCTGQVVGSSSTGCLFTQTFTIYQNLTSPTIVITPTVGNITCNVAAGCFTLTSNLGPNVSTQWYQVAGTNSVPIGPPQGTINIFCPTSAGIYKGCSTSLLTGCSSCKTIEVTASVGVPQFTVTSPSNFTIGCSSKSVTSMQVSNVITSPTPNTPVSYSFVPPPATVVITPTSVLGANPNQNGITIPGVWVVYVKDLTNDCLVSQSISIIQNTMAPNVDFIQPLAILKCKDPVMVLNGISSNINTVISWTVPAIPSNSVNPTANTTVTIKPSVANATSIVTSVGVFTVGAVDNNNLCRSTKTVQILQDIRVPAFSISALSNSVITCKNVDVLIVPIITPTLATALIPTYMWFPPVGNSLPGTSFNSTAAGSHTSISISTVNGCTASAEYNIGIDINPPAVGPASAFTLDCANNPTVAVFPTITGTTTGFTYSWTVPAGAISSNLTSSLIVTNKTGGYFVLVTNTLNGCSYIQDYVVEPGGIQASFTSKPSRGYVPLVVTFSNTSTTSTGSSSIISTWGFGNGSVSSGTVYANQPIASTYNAPGTYSVLLHVKKGDCVDTVMHLIIVDMPSKLEIPNVFTPNGDKSNDIFRLNATNLAEVSIVIFDRWGTKVYDVLSTTGNFAWDGKNLQGKDCAEGTFFYIIKAKGKDEQEFEQKGNVSLFR